MQVTTDPDHKFDLSLQLDDLDTAVEIARSIPEVEAEMKWKSLGDRALSVWRFDLARESFEKANDLSALMLLLLSTGDKAGLQKLAASAGASKPAECRGFAASDVIYILQRRKERTIWHLPLCFSSGMRMPVWTCWSRPNARLKLPYLLAHMRRGA